MPVRRSDEEPLQKLMTELRGDLDLKARLVILLCGLVPCHVARASHTFASSGPEIPEAAPCRKEGAHFADGPGMP